MKTITIRDTVYMENRTDNHFKFYEMTDNGDGTWMARWGKIGTSGSIQNYPMSQWYNKHDEKIRKGYKEVNPTRLVPKAKPANKPVADDTVNKRQLTMVNKLITLLTNVLENLAGDAKRTGLTQSDLIALKNYKTYIENYGSLTSVQMIHMNNIYKALKKIIPDLDIKEK